MALLLLIIGRYKCSAANSVPEFNGSPARDDSVSTSIGNSEPFNRGVTGVSCITDVQYAMCVTMQYTLYNV